MTAPTITQGFTTQFGSDVHLEFAQRGSLLRATVNSKPIVGAEKCRFYVKGNSATTKKSRNGEIPNQDPDLSYVDCPVADDYWRMDIDDADVEKMTTDLRPVMVQDCVGAFGRTADDQIIAAIHAGAGTTIGDGSTGIGVNSALGAGRTLENTGMENDGMFFGLITPNMYTQLMKEPEFANADYVGPDLPFKVKGKIRTWCDIHWMKHTRLTGAQTTSAYAYVYHMSAIGHAVGSDVQMRFNPMQKGFGVHALGRMSMGAIAIDSTGIVRIHVNDNAPLAADVNTSSPT